jgi:hypothetical protein
MKKIKFSFNVLLGALTCFLITSCGGGGSEISWTEPSYKDLISEYHDNSIGDLSNPKFGNKTIYIDASDCIVEALKVPAHAAAIRKIAIEFANDTAINFYGLGRNNYGGIGQIAGSSSERYARITKPKKDIYAPIDSALILMSTAQNDGMLITDFELLTENNGKKSEDPSNYAENPFKKWLNGNNSITLYFAPYTEGGVSKNLYYVFFNHGTISTSSMVSQFEPFAKTQGLTKIEINPIIYKVTNNYGGKTLNGITPDDPKVTDLKLNDQAGVLSSYYNGFLEQEKPYEAMDFQMDLYTLNENYFKEKKQFLQKLYLNSADTSTYKLKGVDVQVYDVTSDFDHYSHCKEAKGHIPKLTKDEGNNLVWDEKTNADPIAVECFESNTQNLKPEYKYAYKAADPLAEYFELNKLIFSQHLQNTPNEIELRTNFHSQFQNASVDNTAPKILRIDLVISDVEPAANPDLDKLKWSSIVNKGMQNESLFNSVTKAIRDITPKGRRLYSYYVKFSAK